MEGESHCIFYYLTECILMSANSGRFEINQLLFVDDTALVADSEKLCRLVNEFGRKLTVNVGKS